MTFDRSKHVYRLRLTDDGLGEARDIEFNAPGVDVALRKAHQFCGPRSAELFEDGRSLGMLQNRRNGGFWIISPPESKRSTN